LLGEYTLTIPPDYKYTTKHGFVRPITGTADPDHYTAYEYDPDHYNEVTYTYPLTPIKTQRQRILEKLEKLLDILLEE
jgi:hypothetical protein